MVTAGTLGTAALALNAKLKLNTLLLCMRKTPVLSHQTSAPDEATEPRDARLGGAASIKRDGQSNNFHRHVGAVIECVLSNEAAGGRRLAATQALFPPREGRCGLVS